MDRLIDCLKMACSVPACMYAGVYMRAADNTDMNLFLVFRAGRGSQRDCVGGELHVGRWDGGD